MFKSFQINLLKLGNNIHTEELVEEWIVSFTKVEIEGVKIECEKLNVKKSKMTIYCSL
jgi:hypothetical protein